MIKKACQLLSKKQDSILNSMSYIVHNYSVTVTNRIYSRFKEDSRDAWVYM